MYRQILKPILFRLNAEFAHDITMTALTVMRHIPGARLLARLICSKDSPELGRDVFGLHFKNPVGLAAGLDKNGEHYNDLMNFGFGFVEIGSLTPQPQHGNPKPRMFRLEEDRSIINRMGINNKGVMHAVSQLRNNPPRGIVAANIAKNTGSINEDAVKDYESAFALLYDFVDMFVLNVSCPNVEGLANLQDVSFLSDIVDQLISLRMYFDEYRPILIKVSPDISRDQLDEILDFCMLSGIDGIVAGNTTHGRDGLTTPKSRLDEIGEGGLSGAALYRKNLEMVRYIHEKTDGNLPIVGVGGIMSPKEAIEMLDAGASLIEIYTGFIYEGPHLVKKILKTLQKRQKPSGAKNRKQEQSK